MLLYTLLYYYIIIHYIIIITLHYYIHVLIHSNIEIHKILKATFSL